MKSRATAILLLGCLLTAALPADRPAGSAASGRFQSLLTRMHQAYSHADWKDYRAESLELLRFLNGSPDAMLELARADARTGDSHAALEELRAIARTGISQPQAGTLPEFFGMRAQAGFRDVLREMSANERPVAHAQRAFVISDAGLLPEDLAYDPTTREFLLTSVREARVVTIAPGGNLQTFARAPDGWPMLAVRVDPRHGLVWVTEVALTGFRSVPPRDWGRSIILEYDLRSRRLLRRVAGPPRSQLGDMALSPAGDLLLSDSERGGMYLVRRNDPKLMRLPTNDFVSPMTPAFVSPYSAFVADYVRGIALLDLTSGRVEWLPMESRYALQGTDGLYWNAGRLIAVQSGFVPQRIVSFTLEPGCNCISSGRLIESGTTDLDPTHGVIVAGSLYYIANSGWSELTDDGSVRPGARLSPAVIMRAPL